MAKTDDLIDSLVGDLAPVRADALGRRLLLAVSIGLGFSALLLFGLRGFRPDIETALYLPEFWVKAAYPLLLALAGFAAMLVVARPGGWPRSFAVIAIASYLLLVALGLAQLHLAEASAYPNLIFGISYWICPFIVIGTGMPFFIANIWFMKRTAPTDLRLAGFICGLTAGSGGAFVYSWGCIENGLAFIAIWYTLGILAMGLIGAASARRLLAW